MWWQDAVVYQVYPRSFQDSDGDGIGDLRGIEQRLDHLAWLGVDALWLSPIYPSPMYDFGYDISDYKAVDPVFGSLEHFDRAPLVPRASGLVHLVGRSEQLVLRIRRPGVEQARRALLPALVLSRAGRRRLAQSRAGGRHAGRTALLDRAGGRRLPRRRDRPAAEGPAA